MSPIPLRTPRLVSLTLLVAIGTVGMALGINALAKSIDQKHLVKSLAPPGSTVNIDDTDALSSGTVVTVACGLLALLAFLSIPTLFFHPMRATGTKSLPLQSGLFAFLTAMLFASLVPYTDFIATRQAKVSAFIGSTPIPQSLINALQNELGVTPIYRKIPYLKNAVILQWVAFFFALVSTILTFRATRIARASAAASAETDKSFTQQRDGSSSDINEKESMRKSRETAGTDAKRDETRTEVV